MRLRHIQLVIISKAAKHIQYLQRCVLLQEVMRS